MFDKLGAERGDGGEEDVSSGTAGDGEGQRPRRGATHDGHDSLNKTLVALDMSPCHTEEEFSRSRCWVSRLGTQADSTEPCVCVCLCGRCAALRVP